MSALMTCTHYTGRSPGGPSVDQVIARKLAAETRFRSLQIGVSQESFGESIQKNMSWSGPDRPLAPEEIPHRLFDRLFGAKDQGWVNRKRSILDAVYQDANLLRKIFRARMRSVWMSIWPPFAIWSAPSLRCRPNTGRWPSPKKAST